MLGTTPVGFIGSPPRYGMIWVERHYSSALRSPLREIGESYAMNLLLSKYGNIRSKAIYACELDLANPVFSTSLAKLLGED